MERVPASADVFLGRDAVVSEASAEGAPLAMTPQIERELVLRAADGCGESFGRLYEHHRPRVQRRLSRLVGEDAAEDITSTTFLKAWQAIPRFRLREGVPFEAWLMRIAHNSGVSHLRSIKPVLSTEAIAQHDGDTRVGQSLRDKNSAVDPHTQAERKETSQMIMEALGELPDNQRDAFVLRIIHGLDYREVADRLGVNVGNARVIVFRSKERLRQVLEEPVLPESDKEGAA